MTQTVTGAASAPERTRRIPPPSGRREPLKVNIFDFMTGAASQLLPLFPYHDAGAIVPTGSIMRGDPDDSAFGHFFHYNTVEEVAITFGSNQAMLQTGQIFVTQQLHGVNSFLRNSADPEAFILITVTQHQAEDGDQAEAILFRCQKCSEQLVRFDYNASPKGVEGHDPTQWDGTPDDEVQMFPTIWGSNRAALAYEPEQARTCPKCGHVSPPHPHHKWGWNRYVAQVRTADSAKRALRAAAVSAQETKAV